MPPEDRQKWMSLLNVVAAITSVLAFIVVLVSLRGDPLFLIVLVTLTLVTCAAVTGLFLLRRDYLPARIDTYWLSYVASDDELDQAASLQVKYFGREFNPTLEAMKSWLVVEPRIIRLLHFESRQPSVCGFSLMLCLSKHAMRDVVDNRTLDWTLDSSLIIPYLRASRDDLLYIMYVVVDQVSRAHASILLADLRNTIEEIAAASPGLETVTTVTSTANGGRLARMNGFRLVREMSYPRGWQYWERSIPKRTQDRPMGNAGS